MDEHVYVKKWCGEEREAPLPSDDNETPVANVVIGRCKPREKSHSPSSEAHTRRDVSSTVSRERSSRQDVECWPLKMENVTSLKRHAGRGIADRLVQSSFLSAAVNLVQESKADTEAPPTELGSAPGMDPLREMSGDPPTVSCESPPLESSDGGGGPPAGADATKLHDNNGNPSPTASGGFVFCPVAGLPYVGASCKREPGESDGDKTATDETSALADSSSEVEGETTKRETSAMRRSQAGPSSGVGDSGEYTCDACGETTRSRWALKRHLRLHVADGLEGDESDVGLAMPRQTRPRAKLYACQMCDKRFTQNSALTKHAKTHPRQATPRSYESCGGKRRRSHPGEKPYACDVCDARFTQSCSVTKHKRIHTGERPYGCDSCGARFAQNCSLTLHKRIHTGEKPYACDSCGARFSNSSHLAAHSRLHTGEKPYSCAVCDARFTRSSSLVKHRRSHTGEKPYVCPVCQARFTCGSSLVAHGRLHTGEKPYSCAVCDARFSQRSFLTKHVRSHTGERPYACTECGRSYTQSSGLFKHRKCHTGERPYPCHVCGRRFPHSSSLRKHEMLHAREYPQMLEIQIQEAD